MANVMFQIRTGSEQHTTERRSAQVYIVHNGEETPLWRVLQATSKQEWIEVGNKGSHGKWCTADYAISVGTKLKFVATANKKPQIVYEFEVIENMDIDVEGYTYNSRICGWIVAI
jgi:hypothetical protein